MSKNQRFHCSDTFYLEHTSGLLTKAVERGAITEQERELIEEFIGELVATSHISPTRRYKLVGTIIRNHAYHPEYTKCRIGDVYQAIGQIESERKQDGTPRYTKNSCADMIQMIKRFFVWLVENGYSDINLAKLNKIKVPKAGDTPITAEMLLTEEDVITMINACSTSRDRALISVLYEGGFRIGELGNLTWGDVVFTDWNVTATTAEKTGKRRYVPLIASRSYLAQWKNDYPLPITPDAFVFLTTTTKKPLQYQGLVKQIRIIATRSGITKYIKPHIFRHSRVTHLIQKGMSESTVKLMMWGDVSTNMMKVYQHLTNKDVECSIAELNGIIPPDTRDPQDNRRKMKPIQCPRCAVVNSPTLKFCGNCGAPLVPGEVETVENMEGEIRRMMSSDPTFMTEMFTVMQKLAKEHQYALGREDVRGTTRKTETHL